MKAIEELYVTEREQWRAWLEKNHSKAKEVWLVYYKAHTGKPGIPYGDSVEEALCFGWVDSIIKRLTMRSLLGNSRLAQVGVHGQKQTRKESIKW